MKKMLLAISLVCVAGFGVSLFAGEDLPNAEKECSKDKKAMKIEKHMKKADTDKDGKVTVAEYVAFYRIEDTKGTEADKDGDGIISIEEFVIVCPPKGEKKCEKKGGKKKDKIETPE